MPLKVREFYAKYLPVGDRLGETFYAVWMVVISLGILGATGLEEKSIAYVIFVAFAVNMTWGVIDGISVMQSKVIERAKTDQTVYDLRTRNDQSAREAASASLNGSVAASLGEGDMRKVIDLIAAGKPGDDPSKKPYFAKKEDWFYAIGIFFIDTLIVVPIVAPLLVFDDPVKALYTSQLIATVFFAALGVAYAKNLHRRKWLAALWLGTLCFSLFTFAYFWGW
ncbi:MAG TPA: hypothetical protein VLU38_07435 [Methanomassiliicoccales archaeon]|nr:hypothetical protein [Methanomassiliicoccales archaeon]